MFVNVERKYLLNIYKDFKEIPSELDKKYTGDPCKCCSGRNLQ